MNLNEIHTPPVEYWTAMSEDVYPLPDGRKAFLARVVMHIHAKSVSFWIEDWYAPLVSDSDRLEWTPILRKVRNTTVSFLIADIANEQSRTLLEALFARELRGRFEGEAVKDLFWNLLVEPSDQCGWLARHVPAMRKFYDRHIAWREGCLAEKQGVAGTGAIARSGSEP